VDRNPNHPSTCARGAAAETIASGFLSRLGYVHLESNFRWRGGEIDLVMFDPGRGAVELVFVEVRSSARGASEYLRYSIGRGKWKRLTGAAQRYLWCKGGRVKGARGCRIDIVWIENGRCEHWKNVFPMN
jgi:putative endonuclease